MVKKPQKAPEDYELNREIAYFIKSLDMSVNEFAHSLGLKRSDNIYNVVNEKVLVSATTFNKIRRKYPKFKLLLAGVDFLSDNNTIVYNRKPKSACLECADKDEIIRTQRKLIKSMENELRKYRRR